MAEYIEREEIMNRLFTEYATDSKADVFDLIRSIPAADVQPVNHWISVKDRLPDKFDYVLCYCKTTTGEGNEFMFGAFHNDTWWLKTCRTYATLEQPQMRVMYWMPLPEPPKDSDTK